MQGKLGQTPLYYVCIADRATKGRNAGSHTQVDARNANMN
jgi:hypothetical protein